VVADVSRGDDMMASVARTASTSYHSDATIEQLGLGGRDDDPAASGTGYLHLQ
jgi:hypothetical protein